MNDEAGTIDFNSKSPEETINLGRRIGGALRGGEVIGLIGPLGSGKTHFIKGIAAGAGATDASRVSSPTFVIINEYLSPGARLDIYHIDAYRIESLAEFEMLGFDEMCYPQSVVLIEWADKIAGALEHADSIRIEFAHVGQQERRILVRGVPLYLREALDASR